MFSFVPLINNSVTIGLSFLLLSITAIISSKKKKKKIYVFYWGCILQCFYIYHLYHSSIQ